MITIFIPGRDFGVLLSGDEGSAAGRPDESARHGVGFLRRSKGLAAVALARLTSPLEGEVGATRREGGIISSSGEFSVTPLSISPPQGGRGWAELFRKVRVRLFQPNVVGTKRGDNWQKIASATLIYPEVGA